VFKGRKTGSPLFREETLGTYPRASQNKPSSPSPRARADSVHTGLENGA
jgi:hypothetical protein